MTEAPEKLVHLICKKLNLKLETKEDRIIMQKTFFLLEEFGCKLGYGFSWFANGPHSQSLNHDSIHVCMMKENYELTTKDYTFSKESEDMFKLFSEWFGTEVIDAKMLQLVASLRFIRTRWNEQMTKEEAHASLYKQAAIEYFDGMPIQEADAIKAYQLIDLAFSDK